MKFKQNDCYNATVPTLYNIPEVFLKYVCISDLGLNSCSGIELTLPWKEMYDFVYC